MFVTALKSFDHNGRINKGQVFECSDVTAQALKRAKLVTISDEIKNPSSTVCEPPSALLPVPPSTQTIVQPSEDGGTMQTKPEKKPGRKPKKL